MRFREHRGSLADSLETQREINSREELVSFIKDALALYYVEVDDADISFSPVGDDPRIGWKDVHIVCVDGYGPFGWLEGKFPIEENYHDTHRD